jgi:hypothetical protein
VANIEYETRHQLKKQREREKRKEKRQAEGRTWLGFQIALRGEKQHCADFGKPLME